MSDGLSIPAVSVYMRINHESMRGILRGILLYEKVYGPWDVRLENESPYLENDGNAPSIASLALAQPDGVIAWGNNQQTSQKLCRAVHEGIPVVLINPWEEYSALPELSDCGKISCDSLQIGAQAANFYLEKGFTRFAFVGARRNVIWSRLRGEGFAQKLAERGFIAETFPTEDDPNALNLDSSKEEKRLASWLKRLPDQTGLFAAMDARGKQIIDLCNAEAIDVPSQISVLSVDNDEFLCQMTNPPLSSIRLELEKAGYQAAFMLHRKMRGQEPETNWYRYGVKLIDERGSTDIVHNIQNPLVAQTLAYIKNHVSAPLSVASISRHFGISRRTLEKRFRNELGYTVFQAILQQRLKKLCRLLTETDVSLTELPELCGFTDDSYMGKVFRKYYGTTLLNFRRQAQNDARLQN